VSAVAVARRWDERGRLLAGVDHGRVPGFSRAELLAEIEASGLTGRGGAAFPTARKLAAVARASRPVVVANGTEGEPASWKDKVLLAESPHLVIDGAVIAARIVGANNAVLAIGRANRTALERLCERSPTGATASTSASRPCRTVSSPARSPRFCTPSRAARQCRR